MKISALTVSSNYADSKTRKYNTTYKYTAGVSFNGKQIKTNKSIFAVFSGIVAFLSNLIPKKKTEQPPIVDKLESTNSKDDEDRLKIIFTFVRPTVDENTITQNLPNGHVLEITKFPDRTIYFEYDNKSGRYVDKKNNNAIRRAY